MLTILFLDSKQPKVKIVIVNEKLSEDLSEIEKVDLSQMVIMFGEIMQGITLSVTIVVRDTIVDKILVNYDVVVP